VRTRDRGERRTGTAPEAGFACPSGERVQGDDRPEGFTVPSVEFDPRVGGGYRIAMQPPDGDLFHLSGEFREVDPPARLAYTFRWDPPDPDDRETVVTLSLQDRGGETEVLLEQGEFLTEERRALHEGGWTESFARLERVLAEL
jgi:uncharacterized protein YndB with AHSA1/START domain